MAQEINHNPSNILVRRFLFQNFRNLVKKIYYCNLDQIRQMCSTIMESSSSHTPIRKSFDEMFSIILNDISLILKENPQRELKSWITTVVEYNVPHGKKIRGKLVETAFIILSGETEGIRMEQAQILGWCVEILQAGLLITDDLMDNGTTRRGQPCWYKVNNMGPIVANDAQLLENLVYQIVKQHFGSTNLYAHLLDLILGVSFKTLLGQSLDTRFSILDDNNPSKMQLYWSIATLKTSYYTIYLPIALAMTLAGFEISADSNKTRLWKDFEAIALKIGTLFQIQDDYFDCFVKVGKLGKEGSDIQEGKCSWLYAKAIELSNPQQEKELLENYGLIGIKNVFRVKELYSKLGLQNEFLKVEQEMDTDVMTSINGMDDPLLKNVLEYAYKKIFKRDC